MLTKVTKFFITMVMVVILAITIFPQNASAKVCNNYKYQNVTASEWQCVKNYARKKGLTLTGNKGKAKKYGCTIDYEYNKDSQDLTFKVACKVGKFCSKIAPEIKKAQKQCKKN